MPRVWSSGTVTPHDIINVIRYHYGRTVLSSCVGCHVTSRAMSGLCCSCVIPVAYVLFRVIRVAFGDTVYSRSRDCRDSMTTSERIILIRQILI